MNRRSLDALFSSGFVIAAGLLVVVGFVMSGNAVSTDNYIHHQLQAQRIAFPPSDEMAPAMLDRPCVAANAGKWVVTASQARCYADELLGTRVDALVEQGTPQSQLFRDETQRGLLLTTSMFDQIGQRSRAIGNVAYAAAAMLLLLALASLVHKKAIAEEPAVVPVPARNRQRQPAAA